MFNCKKYLLVALAFLLGVAGCRVQIGTPKGGKTNPITGNTNVGGANPSTGGDPAEQAAIQVIKQHGGHVTLDQTQPNKPVIALSVFQPSFTDDNLKQLASLTKLRKMSLANTKITGAGFKDLTGLKDLVDLMVSQTPFDDTGLKNVAAFTHLKILSMRGTKITDPTLRELAPLKQLEELAVANMGMGDSAGVAIADTLPQLKRLYIDNSSIGDVGVSALAKMPNLQLLTLNGTRVTDTGLEALTGLKTLEELQLSFDITDKSAKIISGCKNLRVLKLFNTKITDKGLEELGALPTLKELELRRGGGISNEAIAAFIKAHPNCSVKQ